MEGLADFLDSLVGGADQIAFCLLVGGILWGLMMLKPWNGARAPYPDALYRTTIRLIGQGGIALMGCQVLALLLKIWLMAATLDRWPFPAFAETMQFQAGIWRLLFAGALTFYVWRVLHDRPSSATHWFITGALVLPVILSGAWLVHGAGRFDDREQLMTFTVLHQIGAAAWIGGIFQLLGVWSLHQRGTIATSLWPSLLRDFAGWGIGAVSLLLLTGLPMAFKYIDTWNGFIGTGYGNLLLVKLMLMGLALGLAWLNHRGARDQLTLGDQAPSFQRVPYFIQAEAFVLISLLFTAVSLSSQPPAIDIPTLTATVDEVLKMFEPRVPQFISPSHEALLAGEAGRTAIIGQVPSPAATEWSDYNHNISGIFVTIIALLALSHYWRPQAPDRLQYWPLGFALLGIFLFFRSDAETWPLGPIGFWESTFTNGEVLQHRIATFLVFTLGILEFRARHPRNRNPRLLYMFPVLSAFGGLMLLTHSHVGFEAKTQFLIQVGHTLMGFFAIIIACGRWLEIQLDGRAKQIAGIVSLAAMLQIGIILMFYREPLY